MAHHERSAGFSIAFGADVNREHRGDIDAHRANPVTPRKAARAGRKPISIAEDRARWRQVLRAYIVVAERYPSKEVRLKRVADEIPCAPSTLSALLARCSLSEDGSKSIEWWQVGEAARHYRMSNTRQAPAIYRKPSLSRNRSE